MISVASASIEPHTASLAINGEGVPISASAGGVSTSANVLAEGKNILSFTAVDTTGLEVSDSFTIWAGSRTLNVSVRNWQSTALANASVTVWPTWGDEVAASGLTSGSGNVMLAGVPNQLVWVEVGAAGYRSVIVGAPAGLTSLVATLDLDNNDASQGLAGWTNVRLAYVTPHAEVFEGFTTCNDPACARSAGAQSGLALEQNASGTSTFDGDTVVASSGLSAAVDYDVRLEAGVGVAGEVTASRRFLVGPGGRGVTARYRFATSEVFWTQPQQDYYRVRLTNHATGAVVEEVRSVSQLTYDGAGASAWRTLSIPAEEGQAVTAGFAVANAGDTKYPSVLDVDLVSERVFRGYGQLTEPYERRKPNISPPQYEVKQEPLNYLSGAPHWYAGGFTIVNGYLRFSGDSDDRLTSVVLEIARGEFGTVKAAEGQLTAAATTALINRSLGGFAGISMTGALFEVNSSQFWSISDEKLALSVVARTQMGFTQRIPMGWVYRWTRLTDDPSRRFLGRDTGNCIGITPPVLCHGDGWGHSWGDQLYRLDDCRRCLPGERHLEHERGLVPGPQKPSGWVGYRRVLSRL